MLSRRSVLLSALASAALLPIKGRAQTASAGPVTILRVERRSIEVNGKPTSVLGVRQPDGTPGIVTAVGQRFSARVENRLDVPTLIHWHGLTPPWQQDGVPGISGPPISAGQSADYDFALPFGGTFWMHSHQGLQEQELLAAPLIIRDGRERPGEQEVVVMLADFTFTPPEQIFEGLKKSAMASMAAPKAGTMAGMKMGAGKTMAANAPMQGMQGMKGMAGMSGGGGAAAPDLNDVTYDAFLANDRTLADPEVIAVEPGETVLLRVINSSSMSAYHLDLGALGGELIAVDGLRVRPIAGKRFPIAVAQRLEIRLTIPRAPGAHPVLAILEGARSQTGVILSAGRAPVRRIAAEAAKPSEALSLGLERRLRAVEPLTPRKADRVHNLDLTGSMADYAWSINGVQWKPDVPPLPLAKGQRVELAFVNRTPMPHPMHLHGHPFQVVEIDGKRFPGAMRDTVLVTPGSRVVVAFDADNPGWWAIHCHLLYHLDAGMFTTLRYA
jgi:FtsP/CotA-like multicopper oxidase with cupredoxin domain